MSTWPATPESSVRDDMLGARVKSGAMETWTETSAWCDNVPSVPMTWKVYVPGVTESATMIVMTAVVDESMLAWSKLAVIPDGRLAAERLAIPVNWLVGYSAIVVDADDPAGTGDELTDEA